MNSWRNCIATGALSIITVTSNAYDLREMKLSEKVAQSEIVVIGKVRQIAPDVIGRARYKYAVVEVIQVLKGSASKTINVEYRGSISENNPDCCLQGNNYLFFLGKNNGMSIYFPVNGRFSVYNLSEPTLAVPEASAEK